MLASQPRRQSTYSTCSPTVVAHIFGEARQRKLVCATAPTALATILSPWSQGESGLRTYTAHHCYYRWRHYGPNAFLNYSKCPLITRFVEFSNLNWFWNINWVWNILQIECVQYFTDLFNIWYPLKLNEIERTIL